MKTVLTIADSDSSGGAGIQADLKTFCAHGVYGMSVLTALTAQNTLGVQAIHTPPAVFIGEQIDAVFDDIRPDAVKIGMLANAEIIQCVADKLIQHQAQNIVLDPVMVATSGDALLKDDAKAILIEKLLPLANIITPNLPELFALLNQPQPSSLNKQNIEAHGLQLIEQHTLTNTAILIKGGHQLSDTANDLLISQNQHHWFTLPTVNTHNTHGTGCTLSAAIAANLALGNTMTESVKQAKAYLHSALNSGLDLGKGHGPVDHLIKAEQN